MHRSTYGHNTNSETHFTNIRTETLTLCTFHLITITHQPRNPTHINSCRQNQTLNSPSIHLSNNARYPHQRPLLPPHLWSCRSHPRFSVHPLHIQNNPTAKTHANSARPGIPKPTHSTSIASHTSHETSRRLGHRGLTMSYIRDGEQLVVTEGLIWVMRCRERMHRRIIGKQMG